MVRAKATDETAGRGLPTQEMRIVMTVWDESPSPPNDAPITWTKTLAFWESPTDAVTKDVFAVLTFARRMVTRVGTLGGPLVGVIVRKDTRSMLEYCNVNRPTQVKFLPQADEKSATNASKVLVDSLVPMPIS
jgi:hypothetical protein